MDGSNPQSPERMPLNLSSDSSKDNDYEVSKNEVVLEGFDSVKTHKLVYKDVLPQIIISCLAHCIVIQAGINMAYSTILEDGLKDTLTTNQISWIASLVTLSLPCGSLFVGPLMDYFGRKKICIISCIPSIISWIFLIVAKSEVLIYIARIIAGISGGLSTVSLVYISEITHPQIRPMLLCFNSIFVSLGILITYSLGVWLAWNQMAIVFLIMNICIFFSLLFIPESPYWIMCFGKGESSQINHQVETILKKLNKTEQIYDQELVRIKEVSQNSSNQNNSLVKKMAWFYQQLKTPTVYKPTIILLVLFLLQQLAGTYVIIFYALSVFENLGGSFGKSFDKYDAMVILGILRFLMSLLTSFFSKNYGRRFLCITSGLGMAFSMFFSAMYFYLTSAVDENGQTKEVMADQKWILLVLVLFYVCTSCIGFVIIPWTLIGELLPISVRGIMGGFLVSAAYVMMFGVTKTYPYLVKALGAQGLFYFFSVTSLIGATFVYVFLPETLGKSFAEIEKYFDKKD
ncbi:hypothetical protein TKK_0019489 [Trichogramma kaykai]|uniref:Major facilitator superfamily (MFS) profile domain-containing protein n=1 Tax=Trichogramma kaykai TaxID=54128 RepID=A0ABD2VT13_9HYME